jgi:hypothetical protein
VFEIIRVNVADTGRSIRVDLLGEVDNLVLNLEMGDARQLGWRQSQRNTPLARKTSPSQSSVETAHHPRVAAERGRVLHPPIVGMRLLLRAAATKSPKVGMFCP